MGVKILIRGHQILTKNKIDRRKLKNIVFYKKGKLKKLNKIIHPFIIKEVKKKIILATCSSVDKTGINEVLKRPETREALKQDRITKEINLVELLLEEISKNNLAAYGLKDTENAANAGAIKILLITDTLIQKSREENKYEKIDNIMKITETTKGTINIISSEHEGGKKLNGLGGIGSILRYKLNY